MPVTLNIVETETSLGITTSEVVIESASAPGPAGVGVPAGGDADQVLAKASGTDYDTEWVDAAAGGGGAPTDATYLVTTANGGLSAEVVVGATPGGELGGTWASPTVDATHSGSSHAGVQAAAEATAAAALTAHIDDTSDAHDASAISILDTANDFTATDVEGALAELQSDHEADVTALSDHAADTTSVHGIADTSVLETTSGAQAKADAKVTQTITNGVTTTAPSEDAVFDALALKQPLDADLTALAAANNSAVLAATTAAFTTADETKLDGIEAGAQVNPTTEVLQDLVGAMVSGGTETGIAVTYDDTNGRLDFVAEVTQAELDAKADDSAVVHNSLYDANSILIATSDNTPLALTVAASRVLGRKASGDIDDMTGAETAAILAGEVFKQAQEVNAQTGTTYTLVAGDAGKLVTLSNASAITLTLPQDSDATIPVGTYIDLYQLDAGQVTVVAGTGATLRVSGLTAKARAQYARLSVQKVSANTFSLMGDLAAS